jgi:hypothetical protein
MLSGAKHSQHSSAGMLHFEQRRAFVAISTETIGIPDPDAAQAVRQFSAIPWLAAALTPNR